MYNIEKWGMQIRNRFREESGEGIAERVADLPIDGRMKRAV